GTDLVILLTDFLGHNVMKTFRLAAQRAGIRVLACRRSVCSMQQALDQCGYCKACPLREENAARTKGRTGREAQGRLALQGGSGACRGAWLSAGRFRAGPDGD